MHSSTGLSWSSTDDDWTSAPFVDTLLRDSHDQKFNFHRQHEPKHMIWSPCKGFFKWTKLCGQAHLPSWTPDPHQHPFLNWKANCFQAVYPLTAFCLNGELAFDFPELLQGCTLFCEAEQGAPIPGLPASQTALQGVVVAVVGTCGFLRPC